MATSRVLQLVIWMAAFGANVALALDLSPKVVKVSSPPYEEISFVTEGPSYGHTDGAIRGRFHRILFVQAGLAYDRPAVRLETLTYGDEACCRRVVAAAELDLNDLEAKGVALPAAATTSLRFVRWVNPLSADLRYGKLNCRLSGIGSQRVSVRCN